MFAGAYFGQTYYAGIAEIAEPEPGTPPGMETYSTEGTGETTAEPNSGRTRVSID